MIVDLLRNIGLGSLYGAEAALAGYMKDECLGDSWRVVFTREFWSKFSPSKAFKTVVLGAVIGGTTNGLSFIPTDTMSITDRVLITNFVNTITIMGTDQFLKFVVRRTPIVKAWDWIKGKVLSLLVNDPKAAAKAT